jgi:crotonobetainyl-CoA:carnitine CoA-transferase CaiB-like acyl-CoA transferase
MDILRRLVEQCDVVHHNMRYDAAIRLGVDYESLKKLNPSIVYCHTRGFEHGPRDLMPGNDQTGAALGGISWEDGGVDDGGKPIWARTSLGDTGNGFLSALGVVQALYHRDRTGEGQFVDTSISYAALLNTSYTYLREDGTEPDRPRLDRDQLGLGAGYRLYETSDGWICLALAGAKHWDALAGVLPETKLDGTDAECASALEATFLTAPAEKWFEILDAAGVPCEISSTTYALDVFDDQELKDRRWTVGWDHPHVGQLEQYGLGVDLSDTPLALDRPTPIVGQHTAEILRENGYSAEEIDDLVGRGAVAIWTPGDATTPPGV